MSEKYFSREEAERLVPVIAAHLKQARKDKHLSDELSNALSAATMRIMALGGSQPPHESLMGKRAEMDRLREQVTETVNKIQDLGCQVKDIDLGLVDFPSLREGEEILLCWKVGEDRIHYWHGVDEGYAGRKPLDAGGRAGHQRQSDKVQ